jgi:hypothetical protein
LLHEQCQWPYGRWNQPTRPHRHAMRLANRVPRSREGAREGGFQFKFKESVVPHGVSTWVRALCFGSRRGRDAPRSRTPGHGVVPFRCSRMANRDPRQDDEFLFGRDRNHAAGDGRRAWGGDAAPRPRSVRCGGNRKFKPLFRPTGAPLVRCDWSRGTALCLPR